MSWEAWVTLTVVLGTIAMLATNRFATDLVFLGALTLLVTVKALVPAARLPAADEAIKGFGNEGLITVAVLYVVVEGLVRTGAMSMIAAPLLGRPQSVFSAQSRLMLPVAAISGFLNNTPVVAMFMPVVSDLCKKTRISPSKLFIPLSYATILGGVCTLIGTSTNIVVYGLLKGTPHRHQLGMFDITWVGLPCAAAGLGFIMLASKWLLPDRQSAVSPADEARKYTVEMIVKPGSSLVGQTIEQAGLRHLPGLYLMGITRADEALVAVGPQERLEGNDVLVFVGVVESVLDLQKIRGLQPATDQVFKLEAPRANRCLIEAVVSDTCPLVGQSIREGRFRSVYNAAIIAVARGGERIKKKIGDIVLQPGDTLLLEAHPSFVDQQRDSRAFFLVSKIDGSTPTRHEHAWTAMAILVGMVAAASMEWLTMLNAALVAASLMIMTGCCSVSDARRCVDWEVLLVIGAALGIGKAMESSGVAGDLANSMIHFTGQSHPWITLAVVYAVTLFLTEVMSNNAAAALMFPITLTTASALGVNEMPFIITIMIAASCGFATPIGYQTNLMVYGPGGYRFRDYLRIGVPLDLLIMVVALAITPLLWPFHP